ncbi:MAG TPA: YceI family protein [Polyangia bacterium]|nr:YceI family protein [Polyangia bacterium]
MRHAQGNVAVFTFKDGILARAAHDLALRFEQFDIALDGETITASFPLSALRVMGPVEDGLVRADLHDAGKRREIEQAMHDDLLHSARHPSARFSGRAIASPDGFQVGGELELCGRSAPLSFSVRREGDLYRARFEMQPSRWGIAPYRALLGAIKLKDTVRVELALSEVI